MFERVHRIGKNSVLQSLHKGESGIRKRIFQRRLLVRPLHDGDLAEDALTRTKGAGPTMMRILLIGLTARLLLTIGLFGIHFLGLGVILILAPPEHILQLGQRLLPLHLLGHLGQLVLTTGRCNGGRVGRFLRLIAAFRLLLVLGGLLLLGLDLRLELGILLQQLLPRLLEPLLVLVDLLDRVGLGRLGKLRILRLVLLGMVGGASIGLGGRYGRGGGIGRCLRLRQGCVRFDWNRRRRRLPLGIFGFRFAIDLLWLDNFLRVNGIRHICLLIICLCRIWRLILWLDRIFLGIPHSCRMG
mmetsp:Transcript_21296/g.61089  ORF Transcript_21296/g.61089 Transcript_21296/m.61089 type:complete len:300 (+) Transcript_21296:969-1868(+)